MIKLFSNNKPIILPALNRHDKATMLVNDDIT